MNCFDCRDHPTAAVAVCRLCGKGLCRDHCVRQERKVFERIPSGMAAEVRATERRLPRMVCAECDAAVGTADADGCVEIRR
jgi:hypothetical protein